MKKKNMFGPEPIKKNTDEFWAAFAFVVSIIATLVAVVSLYMTVFSLKSENEDLKKQVTEQNIRAHSALNDRDSFAQQLEACKAK